MMWAMVQDGTGKTAAEIMAMSRWDRIVTALVRGRWYREKAKQMKKAQRKQR